MERTNKAPISRDLAKRTPMAEFREESGSFFFIAKHFEVLNSNGMCPTRTGGSATAISYAVNEHVDLQTAIHDVILFLFIQSAWFLTRLNFNSKSKLL